MENILEVNDISKEYKDFRLEHITFSVPRGMICGMIGENGAGKTTTISCIMDMLRPDSGSVRVFGMDYAHAAREIKERIGLVMDGLEQNPFLYVSDLDKIMKRLYRTWDSGRFQSYLKRFQLPADKKVKDLSKGMNVKLNFAIALSHDVDLLILDEATSGLDPVMRDEILDLLQEFVTDENHSILISSHITSDLDKIADYILFIHEGKISFLKSREDIELNYGVLHCRRELFEALSPEDYDAYIQEPYSYKVLLNNRSEVERRFQDLLVDRATIEDIMLFYVKGVVTC